MAAKACLIAVVLGLLLCPIVSAETFTINVNLDDQTIDPELPTVNNWSDDTIVVRIKGMDDIPDAEILSSIDVPTSEYKNLDNPNPSKGYFPTMGGRFVSVNFNKCRGKDDCNTYQANEASGSWTIHTGPRSFAFKIYKKELTDEKTPDGKPISKLNALYGFSIRVEQKPFGIGFSAGFAGFAGIRDKRYRLVPIAGDEENATLTPASDKDVPYQLAAFAHYLPYRWKGSNGPAIGLSIDVPVENLTIMAGWTFAARTLPVVNTGYITFGLAYAQRSRLRPEFEGRTTVPANLSLDTITEKQYGVGGFVSITFGFFGNNGQQFKGVFPAGGGSDNGGGN